MWCFTCDSKRVHYAYDQWKFDKFLYVSEIKYWHLKEETIQVSKFLSLVIHVPGYNLAHLQISAQTLRL